MSDLMSVIPVAIGSGNQNGPPRTLRVLIGSRCLEEPGSFGGQSENLVTATGDEGDEAGDEKEDPESVHDGR